MQFKYGDVFLRKNPIHSFENALLVSCHFSRIPRIGLMSVARFSWVPNLYNIHFLLENHRPQPDPVNSHRVRLHILSSEDLSSQFSKKICGSINMLVCLSHIHAARRAAFSLIDGFDGLASHNTSQSRDNEPYSTMKPPSALKAKQRVNDRI